MAYSTAILDNQLIMGRTDWRMGRPVSSMHATRDYIKTWHMFNFLRLEMTFRSISACSEAMLKRRVINVDIFCLIHGFCLGDCIQVGLIADLFLTE